MAPSNLTSLRTQARYIDEAISHLNSKLNYPGSLFRPSRISHTEEILEELMSENEAILQDINEEKEIAEHNIQQLETFLDKIDTDILYIINEQGNIEEQLKQYGYTRMTGTPNILDEKDDNIDDIVYEENASHATSCEEQL